MPRALLRIGRKRWEPPDEPTPAYDAWPSRKGYRAYCDFLVHHPGWVFREYANIGTLCSFDGVWDIAPWKGGREGFDFTRLTTASPIEQWYLHTAGLLVHLYCSYLVMNGPLVLLVAWWNRAYADRERSLVAPELLATLSILFYVAPVIAAIAWRGDEGRPFRHSVGMVAYYLGAMVIFWTALDWLLQRRSRRDESPSRG